MTNLTCRVNGCVNPVRVKVSQLCSAHYQRLHLYGRLDRIDRDWITRFWARVDKLPDDGCWEWKGQIRSDGYGSCWDGGRHRKNLAHRVALELVGQSIPEGMHTDHLCRNHSCVNPAHLEVVTHAENMRRGVGWPGQNAHKTRCPKGHAYSGRNIRGERICNTCIKDRVAARRLQASA